MVKRVYHQFFETVSTKRIALTKDNIGSLLVSNRIANVGFYFNNTNVQITRGNYIWPKSTSVINFPDPLFIDTTTSISKIAIKVPKGKIAYLYQEPYYQGEPKGYIKSEVDFPRIHKQNFDAIKSVGFSSDVNEGDYVLDAVKNFNTKYGDIIYNPIGTSLKSVVFKDLPFDEITILKSAQPISLRNQNNQPLSLSGVTIYSSL